MREPPKRLRMRYYVWDIRVPPSWLEWVEADIASPNWLWREIARFLATFLVLTTIFGRFKVTIITVATLVLGVSAIVVGREFLRKVAYGYQRYGSDWSDSPKNAVGPYVRLGFAFVFSVVFVLLTR